MVFCFLFFQIFLSFLDLKNVDLLIKETILKIA
jgi:hypothetical protein